MGPRRVRAKRKPPGSLERELCQNLRVPPKAREKSMTADSQRKILLTVQEMADLPVHLRASSSGPHKGKTHPMRPSRTLCPLPRRGRDTGDGSPDHKSRLLTIMRRAKTFSNGLWYHLQDYSNWSWFGTLTFKGTRIPGERRRMNMFYHWLRTVEKQMGLHKSHRSIWLLRSEFGEMGGRTHFHFLLKVPDGQNNPSRCFQAMATWEQQGGGMSRIRSWYANRENENAVLYLMKPEPNSGANSYELRKFALDGMNGIRPSPALLLELLAKAG